MLKTFGLQLNLALVTLEGDDKDRKEIWQMMSKLKGDGVIHDVGVAGSIRDVREVCGLGLAYPCALYLTLRPGKIEEKSFNRTLESLRELRVQPLARIALGPQRRNLQAVEQRAASAGVGPAVFFGHWAVSMGCPSIMDLPQTIQFWALQTDDLIADMNLEIDPALLYGVHEDKVFEVRSRLMGEVGAASPRRSTVDDAAALVSPAATLGSPAGSLASPAARQLARRHTIASPRRKSSVRPPSDLLAENERPPIRAPLSSPTQSTTPNAEDEIVVKRPTLKLKNQFIRRATAPVQPPPEAVEDTEPAATVIRLRISREDWEASLTDSAMVV